MKDLGVNVVLRSQRKKAPKKTRIAIVLALSAVLTGLLGSSAIGATTTNGHQASTPLRFASTSCPKGSKPATIGGKVKCLKSGQTCAKRYQKAYRKHGFTCINGHLRKAVPPAPQQPPPTAPPPAPPAPTPHAQPGHYKGLTSQITNFEFDVTSDGNFVTHLVTGQINEGCTPPASLYGGDLNFGTAMIPIAADGSFTLDIPYQSKVDEDPSTGHLAIVGHLSGSNATGTLSDTVSFTHQGTQYSCGSGLQTWTATRSG